MKSLPLLLLFCFVSAIAQEKTMVVTSQKDTVLAGYVHKKQITGRFKSSIYLDEHNKNLTKEVFEAKIDYDKNIDAYWDADTAIIGKLFTRGHYARISKENSRMLRDYLAEISGTAADSSKTIVINFYSGLDNPPITSKKSDWDIYRKSYTNRLDAIGNINQYWVYKYDTHLKYHYSEKINWLHDKDGLIEASFLPAHFSMGSYIIIMPDGRCFIYYGRYRAHEVVDNVKKMVAAPSE